MAFRPVPQTDNGVHREFELHVLSDLTKHGAKMHGCPVFKVECKIDGSIAVWFHGHRAGMGPGEVWEGSLKLKAALAADNKYLGDTNAVVDTVLQLLDKIYRDTQPLIVRAQS